MISLDEALARARGAMDVMIAGDLGRLRQQLARHGAPVDQAAQVVADRADFLATWRDERLAELQRELSAWLAAGRPVERMPSLAVH